MRAFTSAFPVLLLVLGNYFACTRSSPSLQSAFAFAVAVGGGTSVGSRQEIQLFVDLNCVI